MKPKIIVLLLYALTLAIACDYRGLIQAGIKWRDVDCQILIDRRSN